MDDLLLDVLQYARRRNYAGYDQFDGISSRLLDILPFENKYLNALFQQSVKRAPINIRPLLFVPRERNFKGIGLFVMANQTAYELTGDQLYLNEAEELTEWLVANQSNDYTGFCGGPHYPVQGYQIKIPAGTPDVVSTYYATKALFEANEYIDGEYDAIAETAADFVLTELNYEEVEEDARILKYPIERSIGHTLNANAVGARLLLEVYAHTGTESLADTARSILDYVVSNQHPCGGWAYTDPPSGSHVGMDNYHNGYIIEALLDYGELLSSERYKKPLDRALSFYRETLFEPTGAPNWDETRSYPRSIHSVAEGVILFSRIDDVEFAETILDWALDHLYGGDGQFYHSKRRFYTKRFTLMRWCQAWMAFALAVYLRAYSGDAAWF